MSGSDVADLGRVVVLPVLAVVLVVAAALLLVVRSRRRGLTGVMSAVGAATPVDERPWVGVVANPTKLSPGDGRRRWLTVMSAARGWAEPRWWETTAEDPGRAQARLARAEGASVVLALGGDGTVRSVAGDLAGTGVPLALMPAGTGNLLARNLGIPVTDGEQALRVALDGVDRPVDVADAEIDVSGEDEVPRRETFLVMAGLGFDAEVMATVEDRLKERVGWFAYVVAGLRTLRGRQTRVTLRLDDADPVVRRVRSVVIGNCGLLTGGVQLMPAAEVDDGLLDVVVIAPRGLVGWAAVTATVLTRSRRGHPVMEHFQCEGIEVHAEKPLHVQLDGDAAGRARVLRARVRPGALLVRSPAGQPPA